MIHNPRPSLSTIYGCLTLASLFGCTLTPRLHDAPPPNYSIAGVWELNAGQSTDAEKALASLQPKPRRGRGAPTGAAPGEPAPEVINDPTTDLPPIDISNGGRGGGLSAYRDAQDERYQYRPPLDFQANALLGGQWLKIRQSDAEVGIVNAATSRSFTAGERSVVSVISGVADQAAGWSGRKFVIYVNPQVGPRVEETYSLSADEKRLVVKIEVSSEGRNKAMKVIRTYDRSARDPGSLQQTLQLSLPPTN
jgi:hypothetical protein